MTAIRSGSLTHSLRPMSAGGPRLRSGMPRTSTDTPMPTSPNAVAAEANGSRIPSDVRARVAAIVQRLTMKLLDPGSGIASRDRYVYNTRKSVGKGDALPIQMIAAIAYDDIFGKGRSAAEVRGWLLELCEEIDAWEKERDGDRLTPPDITHLLTLENRKECRENEAALRLAANPTSVEAHEQYVTEAEAEVDAQVDAIDLARKRLVILRKEA